MAGYADHISVTCAKTAVRVSMTAAASRWRCTRRGVQRRRRADRAARGRQIRRRRLRGVRRPARRRRLRGQRVVHTARGRYLPRRLRVAPVLRPRSPGTLKGGRPKTRDDVRSGPTRHLRDHQLQFETLSRRLQEMAFLNKGLTIGWSTNGSDLRPPGCGGRSADAERTDLPLPGRPRRLRQHINERTRAGPHQRHRVRRRR